MGVATTRMPYRCAEEQRRSRIAALRSMSMASNDIELQGMEVATRATGICWDSVESLRSSAKHEHYYRYAFGTKGELLAPMQVLSVSPRISVQIAAVSV